MKITIKTLQQKQFQVDAAESDTVADLKAKVAVSQGHSVESQKLIYAGKVLSDEKTIQDCAIKEKDFLVLMVSKPKPAASAAASSSSTPAPVPVPAPPAPTPAAPAPAAAAPAAAAPAAPVAATTAETPTPDAAAQPARAFGDLSSFVTGNELQNTINNMIDMGFPREQVMLALRASYNNPDRAVEYLMTGIPEGMDVDLPAAGPATAAAPVIPAAAAAPAATTATATPAAPAPNEPMNLFQLAAQQQQQQQVAAGTPAPLAPGPAALEALRNDPVQLAHIRDMVTQNPDLVQPMIQQLAQSNPALAQYIVQNPEAFMQVLGVEGDFEDGEGAPPPGSTVLRVSEEERAAIERLEALGFPRQTVIEAYFACDKNEELAANFLFENAFD